MKKHWPYPKTCGVSTGEPSEGGDDDNSVGNSVDGAGGRRRRMRGIDADGGEEACHHHHHHCGAPRVMTNGYTMTMAHTPAWSKEVLPSCMPAYATVVCV